MVDTLSTQVLDYQKFCETQKRLSSNTLRAYSIDMRQFLSFISLRYANVQSVQQISKEILKDYIESIAKRYAARTCKRKIACMKAFFNHLEYEDIIPTNPFRKIKYQIREPKSLPKTMRKDELREQFHYIYNQLHDAHTNYQEFCACRNIACYELLFSTGIRVGELCNLNRNNINFEDGSIRICGKGNKERIVYITSPDAITALKHYDELREQRSSSIYFFISWRGDRLKEDALRRTIRNIAQLTLHRRVTPHMFRHTFATMMLENYVDIRFIQEILGHSSVKTTQIYLHVSNSAVRSALIKGNPRNALGDFLAN